MTGADRPRRPPAFALFLAGTTVSFLGSTAAPVALAFGLFEGGQRATTVGAAMAVHAASLAIGLAVGGVLADRSQPRRIMIAADVLRSAAQGTLGVLFVTKTAHLPALIALTAIVGAGTGLEGPGRNRFLTQIVEQDALVRANGRLMAATSAASLLGPAIGGALMSTFGAGWALLLDALTYAASAMLLLCIRARDILCPSSQDTPLPIIRAMREGWSEFAARPWVWQIVALSALMNVVSWGPTEILGAQLFAGQPHGAVAWGELLSIMGFGAVLGGLATPVLRPRRPIRAILLWLLLYPLGPVSLALSAPYLLQGLSFLLGGVEMAVFNVLWESTLQRVIPPERLSRVSALDYLGSLCLLPVGYAAAAPLAQLLGTKAALLGGALTFAIATLSLLLNPQCRDAAQTPTESGDRETS